MRSSLVARSDHRASHPLHADLDHLRGLSDFLDARIQDPTAGWISLAELSEDRARLDDALKRNALAYKGTRRIAASFLAGGVTWATTAVPLALMATTRRAIAPDPPTTFVRIDARGEAHGALFLDPSFCVLRDDPAATHPGAHTVRDVAALHGWMRSRCEDALAPFMESLTTASGLGSRALWGQVASSWGSVIVWASQLADASATGVEEAETFLMGPGRALASVPTFDRIEHRGRELVAMRRGVCCLAYKLEDYPYCGSCPLISDEERHRRFCAESEAEEIAISESHASADNDNREELA